MAEFITAKEAKTIAESVNPNEDIEAAIDAKIRQDAADGHRSCFVRDMVPEIKKKLHKAGYKIIGVSGPEGEHWSVQW